MISGVYIAFFRLKTARSIGVGQLGRFSFAPGVYAYVGSAQRNLQARLGRHARRRKTLRWHIDYLSSRSEFIGALLIEGPKCLECRLAAMMARHWPPTIRGFGASDCQCDAHLFHLPDAFAI